MPRISLPFYSDKRSITVPNWGTFELKPFQILIFVSISEQGYNEPQAWHIFPALLDTGNSHCFTLSQEQLDAVAWGMRKIFFQKTYTISAFGGGTHTARALAADVWIHDIRDRELPLPAGNHKSGDRQPIKLSLAQDGVACVALHVGQPPSVRPSSRDWITSLLKKVRHLKTPGADPIKGQWPVVESLRDSESARLSLPNLPLLGLRALCLNSIRLSMVCEPTGGSLTVEGPEAPPNDS